MKLTEALDIFEENIPEIEIAMKENWVYALSQIEKPKPNVGYNLYWVKSNVYLLKKEELRKQYQPTIRMIEMKRQPITPDRINDIDITRAKEYPLHDLLDTKGKKGNISCPFHEDKTPSFQIRKDNTYTCYSCQEHGDSIDLYMKLHNTDFISTVKALR